MMDRLDGLARVRFVVPRLIENCGLMLWGDGPIRETSGDITFRVGVIGAVGQGAKSVKCRLSEVTLRQAEDVVDAVMLELSLAAVTLKPSDGAPTIVRDTFRVYFNRHQAAPLVWCIATDSLEIAVATLTIDAPVTTVYKPKPTPDDEDGKPSAWLEVTGVLVIRGKDCRITRSPE